MKSATTATPMPPSFDAYLRYAIKTNFAYFGDRCDGLVVSLLVRLKHGVQLQEFERQFLGRGASFVIGPMEFEDQRMHWPAHTAFLTVQVPVSLVMNEWDLWTLLTCWVKLSMPVRAELLPRSLRLAARPKSRSCTVLAVIDDGCAFAHERFRVAPQDPRSRVFAIWDQDPGGPASFAGMPGVFGQPPSDFLYGIEYRRASAPGQIGIDDWIAAHRVAPDGRVDEEACYRDAGFTTLSRRVSHGAHVMDSLAGRVPPSARLSFDPQEPPSFKPDPANDVAGLGATDIIFVQIPRAAVDDPTGGWLDMQVTHAMFYILSCIDPNETKRVIVNLSYGPTTGPHDGKALLEYVLSAFTALFNGAGGVPKLNVVLPAGNSRLRDWHLSFTFAQNDLTRSWIWRVPPDNPVPVFAEIWVSPADAAFVTSVRAIAPAPVSGGPGPIVEAAEAPCSDSRGWLITLPPTRAVPAAPLPGQHGDWTIEVTVSQANVKIDAYIARSDPNMGARIPGKPTRFLDLKWERDRGALARQTLSDGAWDISGSRIDRNGTLNGIGTVKDDRILVAAGYRLRDGVSSRYSSLGPSREGPRKGPDHALPTDECAALPGIRGAGNRSAAVFRLVGTSAAAPQLARLQARANPPGPCGLPTPAADVGCGKLDAP
jgi:hypothetical protein